MPVSFRCREAILKKNTCRIRGLPYFFQSSGAFVTRLRKFPPSQRFMPMAWLSARRAQKKKARAEARALRCL
jgi:hypothetical protein